jgi:hypothetical protein
MDIALTDTLRIDTFWLLKAILRILGISNNDKRTIGILLFKNLDEGNINLTLI